MITVVSDGPNFAAGSFLRKTFSNSGAPKINYDSLFPKGSPSSIVENGMPSKETFFAFIDLVGRLQNNPANVLFVIGENAFALLTGKSNLHKYRGSILPARALRSDGLPFKVVASRPPIWYMQGNFNKIPLFEWDVAKAVRESKNPIIERPKENFHLAPTLPKLNELIERAKAADEIAIDTEWYSPDDLAYIGVALDSEEAFVFEVNDWTSKELARSMFESDVPKIMQNAIFDVVALNRIGFSINNLRDDTMIAFHSCWAELREKGLDTLASTLTRWPYYKDQVEFVGKGNKKKGMRYCAIDCVVTFESMQRIRNEEFSFSGGRRGYEITISALPAFLESSNRGIRCNIEMLETLRAKYETQASKIGATINNVAGQEINVRSPKDVAWFTYDFLKFPEVEGRTTAQKVLMDLAASEENKDRQILLTSIIRVRQNLNTVSRYLNRKKVVDRDGRIRTNWNLAGTRGRRFSTTIPWWNGLPFQTIPSRGQYSKVRSIFIADEGKIFVGWDLAQAEARVVAIKTRDFDLLDAMNSGKDIHSMLAPILNLTYEEVMVMCAEKGKDNVEERFLLKKTRHSSNYMQGPGGLKASINREFLDTGVGVSYERARKLNQGFIDLHPGLPAWWNDVLTRANGDRKMTNCFGAERAVLSKVDHASPHHRELISFEPQSTIADATTLAIVEIINRLPFAEVLLHMHDGGLIQIPENRLEETLAVVEEVTTANVIIDNQPLTIPTETKSGYSWGDM